MHGTVLLQLLEMKGEAQKKGGSQMEHETVFRIGRRRHETGHARAHHRKTRFRVNQTIVFTDLPIDGQHADSAAAAHHTG